MPCRRRSMPDSGMSEKTGCRKRCRKWTPSWSRIDAAATRGGHRQTVTIVAVTKTHGPDAVQAAFDAGLGDVGENRVQEALPKMDAVPVPVRWHLIGHLQRNKVKSLP